MKKILFVCEHLPNEGGIGFALLNHIRAMDLNKYDISLCLVGNYIDPSILIPDGIKLIRGSRLMEDHIVNYGKRKKEYSLLRRIEMLLMKRIRRFIGFGKYQQWALRSFHIREKFDVAIAYSNDICKDGVPVSGGSNYCVRHCVDADFKIAWIHNEVEHQGFTKEYCLENFRDYDCVVNVSKGCKDLFDKMTPEYEGKSKVVYNFIDENRIKTMLDTPLPADMDTSGFTIVTAARIEEGQKKISRILECAERLKQDETAFHWYVLGDGPDFDYFVKETNVRKLTDVLHFLGRKSNPFVYMKNADVFVLPSLYESFGLVLKEALISGTPVIATDFAASYEIIENEKNGIICPNNTDGLCSALRTLLRGDGVLNQMRNYIKNNSADLNTAGMMQFENIVEGA